MNKSVKETKNLIPKTRVANTGVTELIGFGEWNQSSKKYLCTSLFISWHRFLCEASQQYTYI